MTPQLDREIEEITGIGSFITAANRKLGIDVSMCASEISQLITNVKAMTKQELVQEIKEKNFDFVEECEPDCSQLRHARHAGSWNHHLKLENYLNFLLQKEKE